MKLLVCISQVLLLTGLAIAQHKPYNTFNKEAELQRFVEWGGKVTEIAPNIYKLQYLSGTKRVFNFNRKDKVNIEAEPADTTIINIWEIDTTLYAHKFRFWQRVDLVNYFEGTVPIEDINQNGLLELYGITRNNWPFGGQVDILEQDKQWIFHTIYSYDSTSIFVQGIGDVDSDGIKEVHLRTTDTLNGKFYKADSLGVLPTTFDFIFYYRPIGQINDMTFDDFDSNGITDCVFIDWPKTFIAEYDSSIENFQEVFEFTIQPNDAQGGFAIGDFDEDRKTELVFSTALQHVYVIEAIDTNQYSVVWHGLAPTYNAYMITSTKDIDGNGNVEGHHIPQ